MTDADRADDGGSAGEDGPGERTDSDVTSPDGLKAVLDDADERVVSDPTGGQPRMMWSSVTDAGGTPPSADADRESGFQFDLGGALARLAGDDDAPPAPEPAPLVAESPAPTAPTPEPVRSEPVAPAPSEPVRSEPVAPAPQDPVRSEPVAPVAADTVGSADPVVAAPAAPVDAPPVTPQRPQMEPWESVVDSPVEHEPLPTRAPTPEPAAPPAAEQPEYPKRTPGAHLEAQMRADQAPPEPRVEPRRPAAMSSVFDDVETATSATTGVAGVPDLPGAPTPVAATPGAVPILPDSNPAAPPPMVEPVATAPSTADINSLRSTQLRQSKQQRQGKLFGRLLLAVVLIGGLVAAALIFGRSLLFDTSWDAELTPIVNEVEAARGAEFPDTVPLQVLPSAEFGELLRAATIGDEWVDEVPQWRALGLATGTVTAESVGAALSSSTTAFYDPASNTVYRLETAGADGAAADLRVALEQVFDRQVSGTNPSAAEAAEQPTFTGVSSLDSIVARSVDRLVASGGSVTERQPADQTLPLPIAYELAAVEVLGEAVVTAAGVDPATLSIGDTLPESAVGLLDDDPSTTAAGLLLPGDTALASPRSLGTDDWSLVWATRLPDSTVDQLVGQVTADSYRPIERNGTRCFTAVFQTADAASGSSTFVAMLSWVAASPATAQAVATQLSETRIQLEACDPGADGAVAPNDGAVDQLLNRQIARLAN